MRLEWPRNVKSDMGISDCVRVWIGFCSAMESRVQSKCFSRSCPRHYNDETSRTGSVTKWKESTFIHPKNFLFSNNGWVSDGLLANGPRLPRRHRETSHKRRWRLWPRGLNSNTVKNCWASWCQTVTTGKQNTFILKQPVWVPENQAKCKISEKVYCNF